MKSKMIVPTLNPRNPFVMLARKRSAGSHAKPHKAQRKQDKQRGYDENGYHMTLLMSLSGIVPQCPYQFSNNLNKFLISIIIILKYIQRLSTSRVVDIALLLEEQC